MKLWQRQKQERKSLESMSVHCTQIFSYKSSDKKSDISTVCCVIWATPEACARAHTPAFVYRIFFHFSTQDTTPDKFRKASQLFGIKIITALSNKHTGSVPSGQAWAVVQLCPCPKRLKLVICNKLYSRCIVELGLLGHLSVHSSTFHWRLQRGFSQNAQKWCNLLTFSIFCLLFPKLI